MVAALFAITVLGASYSVPGDENADMFLVDVDRDGAGDVAVLDGFSFTAYPTANRNAPLSLTLPPTARALDVVPHPTTGRTVVLAVCGNEVRQFDLSAGGNGVGERLLEHNSYLSEGDRPYRFVLVFEREGESLFFLPSAEAIELRTWSGELRERIEPPESARFESASGYPARALNILPDPDIEFMAYRRADNPPKFMTDQRDLGDERELVSVTMEFNHLKTLDEAPDRWPWFALQPGADESPRVRCAVRPNPGETQVRVDRTLTGGDIGPARKYPGMISRLNAELPDFNGDGYTDLLLWNTDRPSVSVATIARMAVQQDWPIRLTAHLFDPESGRYTAKPFAALDVRATWDMLLRRGFSIPLAAWVVDDLNADGRTDVAFTADGQTYVRWMMDKDGAYTRELELNEPIEDVSFAQALDNTGRITIGLRSGSALYVIDPE